MRFPSKKKIVPSLLIITALFAAISLSSVLISHGNLFIDKAYAQESPAPIAQLQALRENPSSTPAQLRQAGETNAGVGILDWVSGKLIGWVAYVLGYIGGYIAAAVFWLGGLLVKLALSLNDRLLADGSIVYAGWPIILSITNLGFVLAIIVMAFATIFRLESYAWKQTLWKLIVAALLVNFSLLIAGAFINVASIFTNFFIAKSLPQGVADMNKFADSLAGMFQAQQDLQFLQSNVASPTIANKGIDFGGQLLSYIAQIFFVAAFTFLAAITLLALAIMLLIRYIALAILLILSPIVWLLWIFPGTKRYWTNWWTKFLRWTFFAPAVSLFLYLTLLAVTNNAKYLTDVTNQLQSSGGAPQFVALTTGQTAALSLSTIANLVLVIGLLFGGLYVANEMGIAFASTASGWASGTGKWFGGWAGRKGTQLGTAPVRWKPVREGLEKVEGWGAGLTGWKKPFKWATSPIRQGAASLSRLGGVGAEQAVEDAKKRLPADDLRLAKMIHTLDAPARVAALQRLRQNKTLDLVTDITPFINEQTREEFVKYGQPSPDYSALQRTVGFNSEMLEITRARSAGKTKFMLDTGRVDAEGKKIREEVGIDEAMNVAAEKFYKGFRPEHFTNMEVDEFFGTQKEFGLSEEEQQFMRKAAVRGILESNPDGLANIYRRIKGVNRDNFHNNLLLPYLKERAGDKNIMDWLKDTHPSLYTFFKSPTATSLGISLGPASQETTQT